MRLNQKGFTLIEMIIVVIATSLLILVLANIVFQTIVFIRQTRIKSQLQLQAQSSLNTVTQFLQTAIPATLVLTNKTGAPAYSEVQFTVNDSTGTHFDFYLQPTTGANTYTLNMATTQGTLIKTQKLADQVVTFTIASSAGSITQIPGQIDVLITLQQAIDSKHTATVSLFKQNIHLVGG